MAIEFKPKSDLRTPVRLTNVTPDLLREKSTLEIGKILLSAGNRKVELGELYSVEGSNSDELVFEGEFSNTLMLGAGMRSGKIRVVGNAGRHIGTRMSGGQLTVEGDVEDYAGAEMTGGLISVAGNAGDFVAAANMGLKKGMDRGIIHVKGNVGKATGFRMRRGLVLVEGNADEHFGWQMKAGTLICFGKLLGELPTTGYEMIRGSIILASLSRAGLLPTFSPSFFGPQPVFGLLSRELKRIGVSAKQCGVLNKNFQAYSGDHLKGGRGEVFVLV